MRERETHAYIYTDTWGSTPIPTRASIGALVHESGDIGLRRCTLVVLTPRCGRFLVKSKLELLLIKPAAGASRMHT